MTNTAKPFVVALTGASGVIYSVRLLETLLRAGREVILTVSESGQQVLRQELDIQVDLDRFDYSSLVADAALHDRLRYFHYRNFMAPIASGSHLTDGMVICPCSGSTMSAIAHACGNNLIQRAADVHLKEGRKLVLVPRETPLSLLQLENMKLASRAGAVILPAMPGWYHGVESVQDLVDFVVARILDQLGVPHSLMKRWGG